MLGTLAKWLRVLGADTLYFRDADDDRLLRIAEDEGRVLLTRDRPLAARGGEVEVYLVRSEPLEEQLAEVLGRFPRAGSRGAETLARCTLCNTPLEEADPERARSRVPAYVARTQERFLHCSTCDKFYWAATHVEAMRERLKELLGEER
jgi:uncharacterized protein with PIN domain